MDLELTIELFDELEKSNIDGNKITKSFMYIDYSSYMYKYNYTEKINNIEKRYYGLQEAASLIESRYEKADRTDMDYEDQFYITIGALSYFITNNLNKSSELIEDIKYDSDIMHITSSFLKQDYKKLIRYFKKVLNNENAYIEKNLDQRGYRINVILFTKAILYFIKYLKDNDEKDLSKSQSLITDACDLSRLSSSRVWYLHRMFHILIHSKLNVDTVLELNKNLQVIKRNKFINEYSK